MKQYHELCRHVLNTAREKGKLTDEGVHARMDRTGTGTIGIFGYQMRFDLSKGFPMLTTKKLQLRLIASELLWFIKGDTNIKFLLENRNSIWNEWAIADWFSSPEYDGLIDMKDFGRRCQTDEAFNEHYQREVKRFEHLILTNPEFAAKHGELGSVYGEQWRSWKAADGKTYDQLQWVIEEIKRNPHSRRLIVSAWNAPEIIKGNMKLPPCHCFFQFYVEDGKLYLILYQRSCDIFLGLGFNIASYALLLHMVAQVTGYEVGEFIHTIADGHIYMNHLEQIETQLSRSFYELPTLKLNPNITRIDDFTMEDIELVNYQAHPSIKGAIAV